jgi:hypothetical protein
MTIKREIITGIGIYLFIDALISVGGAPEEPLSRFIRAAIGVYMVYKA